MLKIFHASGSRSLRVIWMAEEMGLDYELAPEAIGRSSPEFIAVNPARALPAIIDGDVAMSESVAIVQYLAARYGPTPLAPAADDPTYPAYLQYLVYGEGSLSAFLRIPHSNPKKTESHVCRALQRRRFLFQILRDQRHHRQQLLFVVGLLRNLGGHDHL